MVSVQTPHGGRELPYARVLVLPAIVMAAVTGAAVAVVTEPARAAVGWCGGIATLLVTLAAAEALRRGRDIGALRAELARRSARLDECVASQDAQFRRLGQEIVPESLDRMRAGYSPDEVIREVIDTHPEWRELPDSQRLLIRQVLRVIDREDTLRDSCSAPSSTSPDASRRSSTNRPTRSGRWRRTTGATPRSSTTCSASTTATR